MYRLANGYSVNGNYPSKNTQKIMQRIISNNITDMILTTFGPLSEKETFEDEDRAKLFLEQTIFLKDFLGKNGTLNDADITITVPWEQVILRRYADIYKKLLDEENEYTFDEFGEGLLFELFEFFREPDTTKYLAFFDDNIENDRFEYPIRVFGPKDKDLKGEALVRDAIRHSFRYHTIYKPYAKTIYMQKESIPEELDKSLWNDAENMVKEYNLKEIVDENNLDELKPHPSYAHQNESYIERFKRYYVYFWEKYVCQIMNYGYHVDDDFDYPFYDEQPDYEIDEDDENAHGMLELFGLDYEIIPGGFRDIFFWDEDYKIVLEALSVGGNTATKMDEILRSDMFGMVAHSTDDYFTNNDNKEPIE